MKNFIKALSCCLNPYVIGALALGTIVLLVLLPDIKINPVLLIALICPLSMIIMMFYMKK